MDPGNLQLNQLIDWVFFKIDYFKKSRYSRLKSGFKRNLH